MTQNLYFIQISFFFFLPDVTILFQDTIQNTTLN